MYVTSLCMYSNQTLAKWDNFCFTRIFTLQDGDSREIYMSILANAYKLSEFQINKKAKLKPPWNTFFLV